MVGSDGFAHRMIGGMAAAHNAWSVDCHELVATHTGSAAAIRARAYEVSAAWAFGLSVICGLSDGHGIGLLGSRVFCRFRRGLGCFVGVLLQRVWRGV